MGAIGVPFEAILGWHEEVVSQPLAITFPITLQDAHSQPLQNVDVTVSLNGEHLISDANGQFVVAVKDKDRDDPQGSFFIPVTLAFPEWKTKFDDTGDAIEYNPAQITITVECNDGKCQLFDADILDSNKHPLQSLVFKIERIIHHDDQLVTAHNAREADKKKREILQQQEEVVRQQEEEKQRRVEEAEQIKEASKLKDRTFQEILEKTPNYKTYVGTSRKFLKSAISLSFTYTDGNVGVERVEITDEQINIYVTPYLANRIGNDLKSFADIAEVVYVQSHGKINDVRAIYDLSYLGHGKMQLLRAYVDEGAAEGRVIPGSR